MTLTSTEKHSTRTDLDPVVRVRNLRISFPGVPGDVVSGVDFDLHRGEILAIVGESGSGKSVTTRSLVGLAGEGAQVRADRFDLFGEPALENTERRWRGIRGKRIGLVLQDALASLDPLRTIGQEIAESLGTNGKRRERDTRIEELLRSVGIPDPEVKRRQRSFQLSGGQRQRALIASALAGDPDILIADEPTTALDVTVQAQILELLVEQVRGGRSMILVSHDLAVVSQIADRVLVMNDGRVVEHGPVRDVIDRPSAVYTRALLAAVPDRLPRKDSTLAPAREPILRATGLTKTYRVLGEPFVALQDVSLEIHHGRVLGVVGESGSGKSTVARIVTGLTEADSGTIEFDGGPGRIGLVAQDSVGSFDPRYRVGEIIGESARLVTSSRVERDARVRELLETVHLPADAAQRHPRELSGGQRQRVNIARALGSRPGLMVCDEPVSALDISVQAQILDLLRELAETTDTGFLFISHDLGVIRHLCDEVVVMHRGRAVEHGTAEAVFTDPTSPHTRKLLDSLPRL